MDLDSREIIISKMMSKTTSIDEFNFDMLTAPPIYSIFAPYEIDKLDNIATSIKYSGNIMKKLKAIDEILVPRGFEKIAQGTNRTCYKALYDDRFVIKVALDNTGRGDNPKEFLNQNIFKPFVSKIFEVSASGTTAFAERVTPITNREEFISVYEDVFILITQWFMRGKYILADIGTKYFMNYGLRRNFGPVLLDYPYCYELDGNKLYCTAHDEHSPSGICGGEIDFDPGYNNLYCMKCGQRYRVNEVAKQQLKEHNILIKGRWVQGGRKMKVLISKADGTVVQTNNGVAETVIKPEVNSLPKRDEARTVATTNSENPNNYVIKSKNGMSIQIGTTTEPVTVKQKFPRNPNQPPIQQRRLNNDNRGIVRKNDNGRKMNVNINNSSPKKFTIFNALSEVDLEHDIVVFIEEETGKKCSISLQAVDQYMNPELENNTEELETAKADLFRAEENNQKLKEKAIELENTNTELYSQIDDLNKELSDTKEKIETVESTAHNLGYDSVSDALDDIQGVIRKFNDMAKELETYKNISENTEKTLIPATNGEYEDFVSIPGILTTINSISENKYEEDKQIIVFPASDGGYMYDTEGDIICVDVLNGYDIGSINMQIDPLTDIETAHKMVVDEEGDQEDTDENSVKEEVDESDQESAEEEEETKEE